jgi:hypothetical protein
MGSTLGILQNLCSCCSVTALNSRRNLFQAKGEPSTCRAHASLKSGCSVRGKHLRERQPPRRWIYMAGCRRAPPQSRCSAPKSLIASSQRGSRHGEAVQNSSTESGQNKVVWIPYRTLRCFCTKSPQETHMPYTLHIDFYAHMTTSRVGVMPTTG